VIGVSLVEDWSVQSRTHSLYPPATSSKPKGAFVVADVDRTLPLALPNILLRNGTAVAAAAAARRASEPGEKNLNIFIAERKIV
jgi:hypothetical protein